MKSTSLRSTTAILVAMSMMQPLPSLAQSVTGARSNDTNKQESGIGRNRQGDTRPPEVICAEAGITDPEACAVFIREMDAGAAPVDPTEDRSGAGPDRPVDPGAEARQRAEEAAAEEAAAEAEAEAAARAAEQEAAEEAAAREAAEAEAEAADRAEAEAEAAARAAEDAEDEAAARAAAEAEAEAEAAERAERAEAEAEAAARAAEQEAEDDAAAREAAEAEAEAADRAARAEAEAEEAARAAEQEAEEEAAAREAAEAEAEAEAEAADRAERSEAEAEAAARAAEQEAEDEAAAREAAEAEAEAADRAARAEAEAEEAARAAEQEAEDEAAARDAAESEAEAADRAAAEAEAEARAAAEAEEEARAAAEDAATDEAAAAQARADALAIEAAVAPLAASDAEAAEPADVTSETITEQTRRSSSEEFRDWTRERRERADTVPAPEATAEPRSGLSDLERAGLFALGAVAVGAILSGGRRVESQTGDRVVVVDDDGFYSVLKDDDALLRSPGSEVRTERFADGSTRTVVIREDNTTIITVRDADGRALRRVRVEADGREYLLIDDTRQFEPVIVRELPPPIRESIDFQPASDRETLRLALLAADRRDIGRSFSLRQVREIVEVRELAPEINLGGITFETNSAAIQPEQAERLREMGLLMRELIRDNPTELFLVEGHTDAVGDAGYNLLLSDRRAESVALAFSEYFGVGAENIVVQGYGERFLKIPTQSAERLNRRVAVRRITALLEPS